MQIFNDNIRKINRDKALFLDSSSITTHCTEELLFRLECLRLNPVNILEIGARDGILTHRLKNLYNAATILVSEISQECLNANTAINKIHCSDDAIFQGVGDQKFDLIISMLNIHWINDIVAWFKEAKLALEPGGKIVCSFFGNLTMLSLRKYFISLEENYNGNVFNMHIMPFIKLEDITKILQLSGFDQIVTDIDTLEVEYKSVLACIRDIKNIGENAAFHRNNNYTINKQMYAQLFNDQGSFKTKFDIITIIAGA